MASGISAVCIQPRAIFQGALHSDEIAPGKQKVTAKPLLVLRLLKQSRGEARRELGSGVKNGRALNKLYSKGKQMKGDPNFGVSGCPRCQTGQ